MILLKFRCFQGLPLQPRFKMSFSIDGKQVYARTSSHETQSSSSSEVYPCWQTRTHLLNYGIGMLPNYRKGCRVRKDFMATHLQDSKDYEGLQDRKTDFSLPGGPRSGRYLYYMYHIYIYIYICIYTHVHIYIYIYMYICVCIALYDSWVCSSMQNVSTGMGSD